MPIHKWVKEAVGCNKVVHLTWVTVTVTWDILGFNSSWNGFSDQPCLASLSKKEFWPRLEPHNSQVVPVASSGDIGRCSSWRSFCYSFRTESMAEYCSAIKPVVVEPFRGCS
ncbi:hypothetical protein L6452_17621 [Arctium lappa]|uniref:Uncharacterized protein n=1 Tax=Arctium lappa TaxID=4217 RepID=A0ACB9C3W9_ARCLA|nr:hypothetical protein L6452_17621 [Arctium lappa]